MITYQKPIQIINIDNIKEVNILDLSIGIKNKKPKHFNTNIYTNKSSNNKKDDKKYYYFYIKYLNTSKEDKEDKLKKNTNQVNKQAQITNGKGKLSFISYFNILL